MNSATYQHRGTTWPPRARDIVEGTTHQGGAETLAATLPLDLGVRHQDSIVDDLEVGDPDHPVVHPELIARLLFVALDGGFHEKPDTQNAANSHFRHQKPSRRASRDRRASEAFPPSRSP